MGGSKLDLAAVHRAIQGLDEDGILKVAHEAASAESGSWFARARAIGELQKRADYKDAAVVRYARALRMSKTIAFELGRIDRKILLPRLREEGDAADFPIKEQNFYRVACRLGPVIKKSPLAIIQVAERERRDNPRFSTRALRERFGLAGETDGSRTIGRCIEKLSRAEHAARQRYARKVRNPEAALEKARAVLDVVGDLVGELAARVKEEG